MLSMYFKYILLHGLLFSLSVVHVLMFCYDDKFGPRRHSVSHLGLKLKNGGAPSLRDCKNVFSEVALDFF